MIKGKRSVYTLFTTAICRVWASMEQVLYTLLVDLLSRLHPSFVSWWMLAHCRICQRVLKLAVFVLRGMTLLLCRVNLGMWTYRAVPSVTRLRLSLTKSHQAYCTLYLEILSKRDAALAQSQTSK